MSRSKKRRQRRTQEEWQRLIKEFDRGDLSQETFCDQHKLGYSTFKKWKRRFSASSPAADCEPLIELIAPPALSQSWDVELELGSGMTLRIRQS